MKLDPGILVIIFLDIYIYIYIYFFLRVGNSSPRYSENRKNNPLVLSDSVAEPDKKFKY